MGLLIYILANLAYFVNSCWYFLSGYNRIESSVKLLDFPYIRLGDTGFRILIIPFFRVVLAEVERLIADMT